MPRPPEDSSGSIPPKLPPLDDVTEAQRLGLNLSVYQELKQRSPTGDVAAVLRAMTAAATRPGEAEDDIAAEEKAYARLRWESGIFKRRGEAPGLLKTAAKTPGELAKAVLFVAAYLGQLILLAIWQNHHERRELGAFWFIILGILAVTSFLISSALWRAVGESGREIARWIVRFWPITVPLLIFLLGLIKLLLS